MFNAPFGRLIKPSFGPALSSAVAASPWWLSGGILAADCVAAYQPKGAANLAASYINLANPGTYNAAPGAAPAWDVITGWDFIASKYLTCGIVPATTWSILCRYSGYTTGFQSLLGSYNSNTQGIVLQQNGMSRMYQLGGQLPISGLAAAGVKGISNRTAYFNGLAEAGSIGAGTTPAYPIFIGCLHYVGTTPLQFSKNMQALAIYNTPLTNPQMVAVSAAMAAL